MQEAEGAPRGLVGDGTVDPLADPPLKWMLDKAAAAGLKLDDFAVARDAWRALPNDSFKEFMYGVYAIYRKVRTLSLCGRYFRKLRTGHKGAMAVNVSVDESVRQRQQAAELHYRPPTLLEE